MRDYSKVSASFWTGSTGKTLRGDHAAQLVCLYLMTSPHANLIGVYHCPILYIAHETGLSFEGASKGLQRAIEGGFCTYDEASEVVFVHAFARYQLLEGSVDPLKPGDKRVIAVLKAASNIPSASLRAAFVAEYASSIPGLDALKSKGLGRGFDAPPKPEAGTEAETEDQKLSSPDKPETAKPTPIDSRIAEITDEAIEAYNRVCAEPLSLPRAMPVGIAKKRGYVRRSLQTIREVCRVAYGSERITAQFWSDYFGTQAADDFIAGRTPRGKGHENWRPDFEFLTRPDVIAKAFERAAA